MMEILKDEIFIVHSGNASAVLIQVGMNVKRWLTPSFWYNYITKREDTVGWKIYFNHAGMARFNNQVQEAKSYGVVTHEINDAYKDKTNTIIRVYHYDWSIEQSTAIEIISKKMEGKKYQYDNFLLWAVDILTLGLVWLGRNSTEAFNRVYCTELNGVKLFYATAPNLAKSTTDDLTHFTFRNYWKTSPLKLQDFCETKCTLVNEYVITRQK